MLSYPCPRCGRAKNIASLSSNAPCTGCGDASAPPAEIARALQEGRAAGTNLDLRARQVEALDRLVDGLLYGDMFATRLWGFFAFVLAGALALVLTYSTIRVHSAVDLLWANAFFTPLPVHIALGLLLARSRQRLVREARDELQRRPELGTTSPCRSCGGPIEVTMSNQAVRCPHCGTENVLDIREARAGANAELGAFDQRAPNIIAKIESGGLRRTGVMLAATLAAPLLFGVSLLLASHVEDAKRTERRPLDPSHAYAMYRLPDTLSAPRECVERAPGSPGARPLRVDSLIGRVVYDDAEACSGKAITGAFTDGLGQDHLACGVTISDVDRTCFTPP